MDKLTYKKIGNDTISIDLHNGYTVIAMQRFDYDLKTHKITLYIRDNTSTLLDLIEKQENVEIEAENKSIYSVILKHIANLLSEGFFDYYVKRYEYMMKCFDKGHELFEAERLGSENV